MTARWQSQAACKGKPLSWFFPGQGENPPTQVLELCTSCPVREPCEQAGTAEIGVWGGVWRGERKSFRYRLEARCLDCKGVFLRTEGGTRDLKCESCLSREELLRRRGRDAKRRSRGLEREVREFEAGVAALEGEWERLEA